MPETYPQPIDIMTTTGTQAINLVLRLCSALKEEGIRYCHWKSNDALARSATGENDLDLLVGREDAERFAGLLHRLGFKQARPPAEKRLPAVSDYFGYDETADRFVHVHAHYQLVVGHDMAKVYRIPIEREFLDSSVPLDLFSVPAPGLEFIVFVIRMTLKHSTWDVVFGSEGKLKESELKELHYLLNRVDVEHVHEAVKRLVPYIGVDLFDGCVKALEPGCPAWTRLKAGRRLERALQASASSGLALSTFGKHWRRVRVAVQRRISKSASRYRLESGGAIIAMVGGDGAGKSTAVEALCRWLSKHFAAEWVHMGKPRWSLPTITVRAVLKAGQLLGLYPVESSVRETIEQKSPVSPGYPWLVREVCRARDRYRVYVKAQRFAARGGLVIFDRFPLPQIRLMDGRQTEWFIKQYVNGPEAGSFLSPRQTSRFARFLIGQEERYYQRIVMPELLIVLRVDPEIAVRRKVEENPVDVRERSTEIWETNWVGTLAHVVDASRSREDVLNNLKAIIWSAL